MTREAAHPAEAAVLARRRLTNKLIAEHQAERLRPFLDRNFQLITGDGTLILGADAVVQAFAGQFREPGFVAYVRTPEIVQVAEGGERAGERGGWVGSWRDGTVLRGDYLAVWRRVLGQWVIESELYVTLAETRPG